MQMRERDSFLWRTRDSSEMIPRP